VTQDTGLQLHQVEHWVLASALVLSALIGVISRDILLAGSSAAGGLIALGNLHIWKRTAEAFVSGTQRRQALLSVLMLLKMGLLLAVVWLAVHGLGLSPVGLAFGIGALLVGIVGSSLLARPDTSAVAADEA